MSHPIPEDAQRLADRLRMLAVEIESAARYGVPIPYMVSATGHRFGGATFSATAEEFASWAEYTEAEVDEYDHDGFSWESAQVDVNGLPLRFSTKGESTAVAS